LSIISDIKLPEQSSFSLFETNRANLELSQVAEEFEALFVSQMLKQAHKSKLAEGIFDSSSQKTYQSLLDQEWSRKLSTNASFGIAEAIKLQFKNHINKAVNKPDV
jgi:flagellar protein FlgJ